MSSRIPVQLSEWLLFLMPFALLGLMLVASPLRQKVFPIPTPTPIPKLTPTPVPLLWSAYGYNTQEVIPLLPSRDGKTIYTAGQHGGRPGLVSAWNAETGHLYYALFRRAEFLPQGVALTNDEIRLTYMVMVRKTPSTSAFMMSSVGGNYGSSSLYLVMAILVSCPAHTHSR